MSVFGISDKDLLDPNKIKIIDGIAGSGKSTQIVNKLTELGSHFCLASFSNALKFAAADKFGCPCDTICGLEFYNHPYPRSEERDVTEFDTVINDEMLLDGMENMKWILNHVGKTNIIGLTDSHQMLSVENSDHVLKLLEKMKKRKDVIYVNVTQTKRAITQETYEMYNELFRLQSNQAFTLNQVQIMFGCDVIPFSDISYSNDNAYICHSNKIEHEIYKAYNISNRSDINKIPKSHIARDRNVDFNKYPTCDQMTAIDKNLSDYCQCANISSPVRMQGKEVQQGNECYFIVEANSIFTGREVYTVGTRVKDMKSLHIVVIELDEYKDPETINKVRIASPKRLDIPDLECRYYKQLSNNDMNKLIKEHGKPGTYYYSDFVTSGKNIVFGTKGVDSFKSLGTIDNDQGNFTITIEKIKGGRRKSIKSFTKKDATMHFDYMPRVYEIVDGDVKAPRIINPKGCRINDFDRYCDLYSAFPTILHLAPMPAAGYVYTEYDPDMLNFYRYNGSRVTNGSIITEELANKIGESEYLFSVKKQIGCELGHYTYKESRESKEKKAKIHENFKWGAFYRPYYKKEVVSLDGNSVLRYVKNARDNLELVGCAVWSKLCAIMFDAIDSLGTDKFMVVTDGLLYTGDKIPVIPEEYDFRIDNKQMERDFGKTGDKYSNVIFKTYDELKDARTVKAEREKQRRANMTEDQKEKDRERKRIARANKTPEQKAKEAERKRIARAKKKAAGE